MLAKAGFLSEKLLSIFIIGEKVLLDAIGN